MPGLQDRPLDVRLEEGAQVSLQPEDTPRVGKRLGRPAVGEPPRDLVAESEAESDRELKCEVPTATRKDCH